MYESQNRKQIFFSIPGIRHSAVCRDGFARKYHRADYLGASPACACAYRPLPEGFECQVRPRSGLAVKHGITVLNSPGTVDADYRGELRTLLVNLSDKTFVIEPGERIAQMVIARHEHVEWEEVEVLDETERGEGGFGSTGLK